MTLKKLSEQLVLRGVATLRYDKRGAGGWKAQFAQPEDFRFKDLVDDAVVLVNHLRMAKASAKVILVGHSEGGLVAILAAQRVPIDRLIRPRHDGRAICSRLKGISERLPIGSRR